MLLHPAVDDCTSVARGVFDSRPRERGSRWLERLMITEPC